MPPKRSTEVYTPAEWGDNDLITKFYLQRDDAKNYFTTVIKPRLDRSYKLYIAYNGDRAREIQRWQSNISVPYTQGVVETLMPRILDARPEFSVQGRVQDDQPKAKKQQQAMDYFWEKSEMDKQSELVTRASLIYGTGFWQGAWKKDVRKLKFLNSKDITNKRLSWTTKEETFFDGPDATWVDNYSLWYDWHNIERGSKQYWFRRLLRSGAEIRRRYPGADPLRMNLALKTQSRDLTDYGAIRNDVKSAHERIVKGADYRTQSIGTGGSDNYLQYSNDPDLRTHETFEWWRPFDDSYAVMVNDVPVMPKGEMPMPYDFKEVPFIDIPYLRLPDEFEGYGLPMILESPQIMLNMIKNQRLDATTLNIHKMWVVNPLANIRKEELVTRPFGIIYSPDPNGVREIQFADVKPSSYKEEELLKGDMQHASGVDDSSMGVGGVAGSATEVRHLRESTLERVRLFVNHLGEGYATIMRFWMSMMRQFFTKKMQIRIIGEDGIEHFPLVEQDDLKGEFDYKATVLPSIAGMNEVKKKQDMDLFQLLVELPFIDPRKLTQKILFDWNWDIDNLVKEEGEEMQPGMIPGQEGAIPPEMAGMIPPTGTEVQSPQPGIPTPSGSGEIPPNVLQGAMQLLGGDGGQFGQASTPINLLQTQGPPPTVPGVGGGKGGPGPSSNPRGLNRTGKVNTDVSTGGNSTPEGSLLNRTFSLQGKKK